jgi:hypothetical protein
LRGDHFEKAHPNFAPDIIRKPPQAQNHRLRILPECPHDRQPLVAEDSRSYMGEDGFWHIYPIAYTINGISAYIVCPHCKNIHIHSNGDAHRVPHCDSHLNDNKG